MHNHKQELEGLYQIKLPASSCKINDFARQDGGISAKVSVDHKYIGEIEKQLDAFFMGSPIPNYSPNHSSYSCWWDLNTKDKIKSYFKVVEGKGTGEYKGAVYTRFLWAYITKNDNGQYYLYLIG